MVDYYVFFYVCTNVLRKGIFWDNLNLQDFKNIIYSFVVQVRDLYDPFDVHFDYGF